MIHKATTNKKGEINSNKIIVGNFNIPLSSMDRSFRQKVNEEMQALDDILDELDLVDIYRAFHPKAADYTFFSRAHGTFSSIDNTLATSQDLTNLRKLKS